MESLLRSFEEHSIIWILISGGVGGFIGATVKFFYEQVIPSRLQGSRASRESIKKYKYPLIQAVDSLDKFIDFLFSFVENKRYEMRNDEYFRLSTLYTFGRFLAWAEIIEETAIFKYEPSSKGARNFHICFNGAFKGFNSFYYFNNIEGIKPEEVRAITVPRLTLQAIGELMIDDGNKQITGDKQPIRYIDFVRRYKENEEFRQWFASLNEFIDQIWEGPSSLAWTRMVLFSAKISILRCHLDHKNRYTKRRVVTRINTIHPIVAKRLLREFAKGGWLHLVEPSDQRLA